MLSPPVGTDVSAVMKKIQKKLLFSGNYANVQWLLRYGL
jgi:hypothetical protein